MSLVMLELTDDREENLRQIRTALAEARDTIILVNDQQAEPVSISDDGEL